jgi:membrane-bound lytic murein transglycosylase D
MAPHFNIFTAILLSGILLAGPSAAQQKLKTKISRADTTVKDSALSTPVWSDPKDEFKNLYNTAVRGDSLHPARLNPLAVSFVQDYIAKNGAELKRMKQWGRPYFDMMDNILAEHGLPKELKYLAVIESNLQYNEVSNKGAVGPWQLMPEESALHGLKMSRYQDERMDFYKSTHVAAAILADLYSKYHDWLLVIAAYNCGPGNVNKAIRKSGSNDFWLLQYDLPVESMNHVKKFIATHYIMEGEGGITTVTRDEMKEMVNKHKPDIRADEMTASQAQSITGRYLSAVIVKYISWTMQDFFRYNPAFDEQLAAGGQYELRLPADKMRIFLSKKNEILEESLKWLLQSATGSGH